MTVRDGRAEFVTVKGTCIIERKGRAIKHGIWGYNQSGVKRHVFGEALMASSKASCRSAIK